MREEVEGRSPLARRSREGHDRGTHGDGSISARAEEPATSPTSPRSPGVEIPARGGADPTLPDGDGAGFSVAPSERVDAPTPTLDQLYRVPGAAHGVCNGMQAGPGDHVRLVPCRDNPSCVVARAGTTCDLTAGDAAREARLERLRAGGCAFVIVQTDTPGASITWELQQ